MCAGLFLVQLDVTVVNVAVPSLRESLGAAVGGLQWIVDGYAIALASLMLPAGTLGDRYGHRRVVLAGLAIFGAGSLGCGLAPGTGALVAARALQGAGASRRRWSRRCAWCPPTAARMRGRSTCRGWGSAPQRWR
jgi:MFS transporter, DHA2 family, methylenomycin A resistance protein